MKHTVIYHSADFDGLFCREIARKFLPKDTEFIGWNFGDTPIPPIIGGKVYVLDLPVDRVFGYDCAKMPLQEFGRLRQALAERIIWIDHHKSSIQSHPPDLPGYRIDGVAACRLVWQWFICQGKPKEPQLPVKEDYGVLLPDGKRTPYLVYEPLAVRLAGEYDVWDKRDPAAEVFQFGLRSVEEDHLSWPRLLYDDPHNQPYRELLLSQGRLLQRYQQQQDASIVRANHFLLRWEGLTWLALNTARCNSLSFAALDVPATGHDALLGFRVYDKGWTVSLYHARHRTDLDLSLIAVKHNGGGHRGACGFVCSALPFALNAEGSA